jgi:hypothetical protein
MFAKDKLSLRTLLSTSDQLGILTRGLLHAVEDHGGSIEHVDSLLASIEGDGAQLAEIAKFIVGPIWNLTKHALTLDIDFDAPLDEFCATFDGTLVSPWHLLDSPGSKWAPDTHPKGPCGYKLVHSEEPVPGCNVQKIGRYEHAGRREILAYAAALKPEQLSGCRILALGSPTAGSGDERRHYIFPALYAPKGSKKIYVTHHGVEDPLAVFWQENFYLVRVYD